VIEARALEGVDMFRHVPRAGESGAPWIASDQLRRNGDLSI